MASPFPGMDPYIEQPALWSDFHADLAGEIRAALNRVIQPRYVALLTPYTTYEVIEIADTRTSRALRTASSMAARATDDNSREFSRYQSTVCVSSTMLIV